MPIHTKHAYWHIWVLCCFTIPLLSCRSRQIIIKLDVPNQCWQCWLCVSTPSANISAHVSKLSGISARTSRKRLISMMHFSLSAQDYNFMVTFFIGQNDDGVSSLASTSKCFVSEYKICSLLGIYLPWGFILQTGIYIFVYSWFEFSMLKRNLGGKLHFSSALSRFFSTFETFWALNFEGEKIIVKYTKNLPRPNLFYIFFPNIANCATPHWASQCNIGSSAIKLRRSLGYPIVLLNLQW